MVNLLSNAINYSKEETTVTVTVTSSMNEVVITFEIKGLVLNNRSYQGCSSGFIEWTVQEAVIQVEQD